MGRVVSIKATRNRKTHLAAVGGHRSCPRAGVARLWVGLFVERSGESASTKDWSVTLGVAQTSTKAATTIPATVAVDHWKGHRADAIGCTFTDFEVLVGNPKVPNSPIVPTVLCDSSMSARVHVFHMKIQTTY
jgi:hypothetical protein